MCRETEEREEEKEGKIDCLSKSPWSSLQFRSPQLQACNLPKTLYHKDLGFRVSRQSPRTGVGPVFEPFLTGPVLPVFCRSLVANLPNNGEKTENPSKKQKKLLFV